MLRPAVFVSELRPRGDIIRMSFNDGWRAQAAFGVPPAIPTTSPLRAIPHILSDVAELDGDEAGGNGDSLLKSDAASSSSEDYGDAADL